MLRHVRRSNAAPDSEIASDITDELAEDQDSLAPEALPSAHSRRQLKLLSLFRHDELGAADEPSPAMTREAPRPDTLPPDVGDDVEPESPEPPPGTRRQFRIGRPSNFVAALLAVTVVVAFVGGLTYYGAREFSRRAADARASHEAASLANLSAYTATGDAFNGYLQILRYADDPVVNAPASTKEQRVAAMQQLLYLNTNRLSSLAIVTRQGVVLAATDPDITAVPESEAFKRTRANLSPTNSDIILPEGEARGYVEFTAPLKDPTGTVWAILYGRADPDTLWQQTLKASVDGSRNVVINNAGQFSAGVPQDLLRQPWKGVPLPNGSVRADIVGVDSICGLGPIGSDTQIDHGWNVASCLPVSLIQVEAGRAMGQQGLVTLAGCVLAVVLAAGLLRVAIPGGPPQPRMSRAEQRVTEAVRAIEAAWDSKLIAIQEPELDSEPLIVAMTAEEPLPAFGEMPTSVEDPEHAALAVDADPSLFTPAATEAPAALPALSVDAVSLIDAYEHRNARLSERVRQEVQARLMIATARADEAYRLYETHPEHADALHAAAMQELEEIRDRELRGVGQEMHPSLVRLGLGGALRSLRRDFAHEIELSFDVDPLADAVGGGASRVAIDGGRRLVLYRAARDFVRAMADAGSSEAAISVKRDGDMLLLAITSNATGSIDEMAIDAARLSIEAYGGRVAVAASNAGPTISAQLPAPGVPVEDEPYVPTEPVTPDGLVADLDDLRGKVAAVRVSLEAEHGCDVSGLSFEMRRALLDLAEASIRTLASAGAAEVAIGLGREDAGAVLTIAGDTGGFGFDAGVLDETREIIETEGGAVTVTRSGHTLTVRAAVPLEAEIDSDAATAMAPPPKVVTFALPEDEERSLGAALRELARDLAGHLDVALDVPDAFDDARALPFAVARDLRVLIGTTVRGTAAAGAPRCAVALQERDGDVYLTIDAAADGALDTGPIMEAGAPIEAQGGTCTLSQRDGVISLTVRIPTEAAVVEDAPAVVRLDSIAVLAADEIELEDDHPAA